MKKFITAFMITLSFVVGGLSFMPALAYADAKSDVCDGVGLTGSSCSGGSGPSVDSTIKLVINVLSFIVGIAAVIMIIIGGLKYVTSQGESNSTASAKNTILYAIIGLVVVALAQIIVRFVLSRATNTP